MSDTAASSPVVLAPLTMPPVSGIDPYDMANALFGLVVRCAAQAALHGKDYLVTDATVAQVAGAHLWRERADLAARAGYWTRDEAAAGWLIHQDTDNFLHIRLKAELDWERQRKRDTATPSLVVPVRLRDGDSCRYCGCVVSWTDHRGARGATYDHRRPGFGAQSPDDLRVACRSCNSQRGDNPDADQIIRPRPAPAQPYYGPETRKLLAAHGHTVPGPASASTEPARPTNVDPAPARPAAQADPARSDPPARRTPPPPATRQPAGPRPADIHDRLRSVDLPEGRGTEASSPGREGPVRSGSGRAGNPVPTGSRGRRRRGRRAKPK